MRRTIDARTAPRSRLLRCAGRDAAAQAAEYVRAAGRHASPACCRAATPTRDAGARSRRSRCAPTPVTERRVPGASSRAHPEWQRDRVARAVRRRRATCSTGSAPTRPATGARADAPVDRRQLVRRRRPSARARARGCRPGTSGNTSPPPMPRARDARDDPAWRARILAWYARPGERAAARGRRRGERLRRARPARPGLGMGRRLQRAVGRRRQPHPGRSGHAQVLRRRRDQPAATARTTRC